MVTNKIGLKSWYERDQIKTPADPFIDALIDREKAPELIADLVAKLGDKLGPQDAASVAALARSLTPHDPWITAVTSPAIMATVPRWHWAIARDERRNAAYDKALRACITPESIVLEVGTGSGILAMMAARAGARHVYTIEIVPLIAQAARENIRRNGFADRVTVICADATTVSVGAQLPERCNVFLHEIISNDLLGEHVLPITEYARDALLTDDALHMPDAIWMTCQLAQVDQPARTEPIGAQSEFDLSAMDLLHTPDVLKHGPLAHFQPRTEGVEVLRFDMTGANANPKEDDTFDVPVTDTGSANAIVQWIGFSFPDGTEFTNPPDVYSSWALRVWPIADRSVIVGDVFKLRRRCDRFRAVPMDAE
ncbi:50S ribosomal protein L11 methyltransferase [Octadecabacter sp. G9-8]|uniref:50S ribosomal protein L11 methyltransferase n=1 Tax=Octadecabacter dasysiphoniae TaxID=2909341 RepID=A0ABS9CYL5_9RHOB|nr:50S ribosomal protein L11 methyltransferase [Octadecabacter dasysiphoniae]MCF2872352.1 50S ribosomal protein L11 methyltransferase [Octadecabacter dasysiphoniae]